MKHAEEHAKTFVVCWWGNLGTSTDYSYIDPQLQFSMVTTWEFLNRCAMCETLNVLR